MMPRYTNLASGRAFHRRHASRRATIVPKARKSPAARQVDALFGHRLAAACDDKRGRRHERRQKPDDAERHGAFDAPHPPRDRTEQAQHAD